MECLGLHAGAFPFERPNGRKAVNTDMNPQFPDGFQNKAEPIMIETIITFLKAFAAFLTSIGVNPAHLFAGLAGAFVRMFIQGKNSRQRSSAAHSVARSVPCTWLRFAQWLNITDAAANGGLAFAIGMIGLSLAEGFVRIAQRWANNPRIGDIKKIADIVNDSRNDRKDEPD